MGQNKAIQPHQKEELLNILESRFHQNMHRHKDIEWSKVLERLELYPGRLWTLKKMEETGGEPDVVGFDARTGSFIFFDCSAESPKGRRSICYDHEALLSRKTNKPANCATGMAMEMGIELLSEKQYHELQELETFDTKTSSWLRTPLDIREKGGALFGDYRYGHVFIYHNGAESYYASRGFRGFLLV
jgi:hypothetical protein